MQEQRMGGELLRLFVSFARRQFETNRWVPLVRMCFILLVR